MFTAIGGNESGHGGKWSKFTRVVSCAVKICLLQRSIVRHYPPFNLHIL